MPVISTEASSSVYYRKMGAGPALVLLHGFPESGTLWQNIWDELSRSYTLIIPDFPGSGNSVLDRETSVVDMAECVNAIMYNEAIDAAIIAGHSMGGYVAFAFAALYPHKVKGLSLVHSTSEADSPEKINTRLKSIELIRKGAKSTFISHMIPNLFSATFNLSDPSLVKAQVEEAMKMSDDGMVNFYNAMISRQNNTDVLHTAVFPVQWIIGADDTVIPYKKILELCYKVNINFVSFYQNCGHMSMIEEPQKLTDDLILFIKYCYL